MSEDHAQKTKYTLLYNYLLKNIFTEELSGKSVEFWLGIIVAVRDQPVFLNGGFCID